jgi:hypothetical protein
VVSTSLASCGQHQPRAACYAASTSLTLPVTRSTPVLRRLLRGQRQPHAACPLTDPTLRSANPSHCIPLVHDTPCGSHDPSSTHPPREPSLSIVFCSLPDSGQLLSGPGRPASVLFSGIAKARWALALMVHISTLRMPYWSQGHLQVSRKTRS